MDCQRSVWSLLVEIWIISMVICSARCVPKLTTETVKFIRNGGAIICQWEPLDQVYTKIEIKYCEQSTSTTTPPPCSRHDVSPINDTSTSFPAVKTVKYNCTLIVYNGSMTYESPPMEAKLYPNLTNSSVTFLQKGDTIEASWPALGENYAVMKIRYCVIFDPKDTSCAFYSVDILNSTSATFNVEAEKRYSCYLLLIDYVGTSYTSPTVEVPQATEEGTYSDSSVVVIVVVVVVIVLLLICLGIVLFFLLRRYRRLKDAYLIEPTTKQQKRKFSRKLSEHLAIDQHKHGKYNEWDDETDGGNVHSNGVKRFRPLGSLEPIVEIIFDRHDEVSVASNSDNKSGLSGEKIAFDDVDSSDFVKCPRSLSIIKPQDIPINPSDEVNVSTRPDLNFTAAESAIPINEAGIFDDDPGFREGAMCLDYPLDDGVDLSANPQLDTDVKVEGPAFDFQPDESEYDVPVLHGMTSTLAALAPEKSGLPPYDGRNPEADSSLPSHSGAFIVGLNEPGEPELPEVSPDSLEPEDEVASTGIILTDDELDRVLLDTQSVQTPSLTIEDPDSDKVVYEPSSEHNSLKDFDLEGDTGGRCNPDRHTGQINVIDDGMTEGGIVGPAEPVDTAFTCEDDVNNLPEQKNIVDSQNVQIDAEWTPDMDILPTVVAVDLLIDRESSTEDQPDQMKLRDLQIVQADAPKGESSDIGDGVPLDSGEMTCEGVGDSATPHERPNIMDTPQEAEMMQPDNQETDNKDELDRPGKNKPGRTRSRKCSKLEDVNHDCIHREGKHSDGSEDETSASYCSTCTGSSSSSSNTNSDSSSGTGSDTELDVQDIEDEIVTDSAELLVNG